jgi:hypothetical protein
VVEPFGVGSTRVCGVRNDIGPTDTRRRRIVIDETKPRHRAPLSVLAMIDMKSICRDVSMCEVIDAKRCNQS